MRGCLIVTDERTDRRLVGQFLRDNRQAIDLLSSRRSETGFAVAVERLFGLNPSRGKIVRIANGRYGYHSSQKQLVSFLPEAWINAFEQRESPWPGCRKWWAGYPLMTWIEILAGDDRFSAYLRLNAEVGPLAPQQARSRLINMISIGAAQNGLSGIRFAANAGDTGQLYSRFLQRNRLGIADHANIAELEAGIIRLLQAFEPEFKMIGAVLGSVNTGNTDSSAISGDE